MSRRAILLLTVCCAFAGACHRGDAKAHLTRASAFVEKGKTDEAIIEYRTALQINPNLGDARLKLGDAYMQKEDFRAALGEYTRAADLLPSSLDAQLKAGRLLVLARSFDDARGRADKALALDPKNIEAQLLKGNALAGLKDTDGAINQYTEVIALDPTQPTAYASLGTLQLKQGKREEAEATFRKAVESAPKSVPARLALANFLWATDRRADSESVLKGALETDPGSLDANRALGLLYMTTGRAAEAEPYFAALARLAHTPDASLVLADYYAAVKRNDDARKTLTELVKQPDVYAPATLRLASLDAREGNRVQAEGRLRELLAKQPKYPGALLMNARLLLADGKRTEALAAAKAAIESDPNSLVAAQGHLTAGLINASADRYQDAIREYEEVLKLQTKPFEADVALAQLHLRLRDANKALSYAEQALSIQPTNVVVRSLVIRAKLAKGDRDSAKADLASLAKDFPNTPGVLMLQAAVQLVNKQFDAARASYAKAVQIAPRNSEALAGLVQIDLGTGHAKEALAALDSRLKESAPSVDLLILQARAYQALRDFQHSEASLLQALARDPERLQTYVTLAGFYASQNRLEDAKSRLQEVVKRDPKSVSTMTLIGMLLEKQGNVREAEREYQQALAVDQGAAIAANNLACILVAGNRKLDEALQLAQSAHQRAPDDPSISDTLGWTYYRKEMAQQGIPFLEESVQRVPEDPVFQYHLGMAYAHAGALDSAKQALKKALALGTNFEGADEARKTLASLGA